MVLLRWGSFVEAEEASERETIGDSVFRYKMHWISKTGPYTYLPEKWGKLQLTLLSGQSTPREVLCTTAFEKDETLQYGRRIWMPARSQLQINHPIRPPKCDPGSSLNLNLHSLVFDVSTSEETIIKNEAGLVRHEGAMILTDNPRNTGLIEKPRSGPDEPPSDAIELLAACRVQNSLSNRLVQFQDDFLPAEVSDLAVLEHLVIADNRLIEDFAATTAVRQWMHEGGHVWVMLDRVDPIVLERLMGDEFTGYVVDRIGLTTVKVDQIPSLSDAEIVPGKPVEFDDPVPFVRLVVSGFRVTHTIDGWPASMTRPCGEGKLIITTLGPRGWMQPRPEEEQRKGPPQLQSNFIPTDPMGNVINDFFTLPLPPLLPAAAIEPQVQDYIGYNILPWSMIVGTLMGFSVCVVGAGSFLMRFGRLEHLGWVGVALSLLVSLFLIYQGRSNRHAIPAILSTVQLVQSMPGTDDIRSTGLISVYHPEGSEFPITATHGGELEPDMSGLEALTRRMITTDLGVYHWDNVHQAAGSLRPVSFKQSDTEIKRLHARATFDATGITGTYSGSIPPGNDAILASKFGRLAASMQSDGTFRAQSDDVMKKGQFLAAGLLTDEQNRRQRTLIQLLDNPQFTSYPDYPQLMFWSQPVDFGFQFGENLAHRGAALVAVPLVFERPTNGTEFVIPSPLLPYYNRSNPDGSLPSALWNPSRKEWQERSDAAVNWFSFQIPQELLPLSAQKARLDFQVSGPIGRIEILGLKDGSIASLSTQADPVGTATFDLTDPEALSINAEGHLSLGMKAGIAKSPDDANQNSSSKTNYWRIESMALQLWVETTEPAEKD